MYEEFRLELPSEPQYVRLARLAIANIADQVSFPEEAVDDIKVCISEACNSILKSPKTNDSDRIGIQCRMTDDGLLIKVDASNNALNERFWNKHHTMGKTFVESLMDDVKYEQHLDGSSTIKMIKELPQ